MNQIVPCLWFDHNASDAVTFYQEIFDDVTITDIQHYPTLGLLDFQREFAGEVLTIAFRIGTQPFVALNAGPEGKPNPSVSFMLNFDPSVLDAARDELDRLWGRLSGGGRVLMPVGEYPFSQRYGWVQDRFGISWQLILTNPIGEPRPFITPTLLFGGPVQNRAAEAMAHYLEVFGGGPGTIARYAESQGPASAGAIMFADFHLGDQWFAAMDAGAPVTDLFTIGISFIAECPNQAEIDRLWAQLSASPDAEQCGWCQDKFGLSWQVVPTNLNELMANPDAFEKLLGMTKIEISAFG